MKRVLVFAFCLSLILGALPQPAAAAPAAADKPICLPPPYASSSEDCEQLGPSAFFSQMAELGFELPMRQLAANPVDPALSELDINYATVSTIKGDQVTPRPIFPTIEAAAAYTNPSTYLQPGTGNHYISYSAVQSVAGSDYYLTENGWMARSDLSPASVRQFTMGMEFLATPENPFGWVLEYANAETAPFNAWQGPSMSAERSSNTFEAYSLQQVYDIQEEGDLKWYMVGPDLWLNSLQMRLVYPDNTPPEGVDNGRWIDINLEEQSIAIYEDSELAFATLVATGLDNLWTRPGTFQIYEKHEATTMSGDFSGGAGGYYYLADVPWTLYYDQARAIHGAYWRPKQFFGFQGSHGCVNLPVGDAHWVFNWAQVGDWVYVHDPSGRTPTDEEFTYGAGAP